MTTFAEKLRSLRQGKGLTQEQLARATGIPIGTIREYEQGKRRKDPSLRTAIALAEALGVDCRAFAESVAEEPAKKPAAKRRQPKKP